MLPTRWRGFSYQIAVTGSGHAPPGPEIEFSPRARPCHGSHPKVRPTSQAAPTAMPRTRKATNPSAMAAASDARSLPLIFRSIVCAVGPAPVDHDSHGASAGHAEDGRSRVRRWRDVVAEPVTPQAAMRPGVGGLRRQFGPPRRPERRPARLPRALPNRAPRALS